MNTLRGDVAIIGMACIFPGAPDLRSYWQNIVSKVDAVSDPPEGWGAELFYDPDSKEGDRIYCKRGGYLKDLAQFDPLKYGVMPNSVDGGEPDHFLALRVAYEALEDAGYLNRPTDRGDVAVILGRGTYTNRGDTNLVQHGLILEQTIDILQRLHPEHTQEELRAIKQELRASLPPFNAEIAPGLVPNIMTGRIANRLDLMGPNYTVDAACASSLIAVELGMQELLTGKCDLVIAGGVHVSTPPPIQMVFCQVNALSRRGQIRPFDKDADGTLLGEGIGMVVLKRREDAERDGDRIYAVIKGVGTASDGRALGLLAPRLEGEELAVRRAYKATGISPQSVSLIEAHGTATPVGDTTEIQALRQVFGPRQGGHPTCALGTVKSMISHLIPAGGIAGLIKVALALHHRVLPATIHCEEPNPKLELDQTPFYINTETRPWIHAGPEPRRAGVNAFGFGGINAHAILEEHTGQAEGALPSLMHRWDSEVFILQGESRQALIESGARLLGILASHPELQPKDLASTLNCPLRESGRRLAIVARDVPDLEKKLRYGLHQLADPRCRAIKDRSGIFFAAEPLKQDGTLAFLFPGEGSQYGNMLADLCLHFPEVRARFDRADRVFRDAGRELLPSHVVFPPPLPGSGDAGPSAPGLWQMDFAVESVFTADQALFTLLGGLGIRPQALVGHSSGEFSALVASGTVKVDDEDQLIQHSLDLLGLYGTLRKRVPLAGLMTVGAADPALVASVVAESQGSLHVTMDNCPHQVIVCGPEAALAAALDRLQRHGAICSLLPFDRAYHTPMFREVADQLLSFFRRLRIVSPHTALYSCATAQPYPTAPDDICRLAAEQWARPVRFRETIQTMYAAGVRIFVEVGPRGNLANFVDDILRDHRYLAVPSNVPHRSGITQLHHLIGLLAAHGVHMRLEHLYARRAPRRLSLDPSHESAETPGKAPGATRLALELPRLHIRNGWRAGVSGKLAWGDVTPTPREPHGQDAFRGDSSRPQVASAARTSGEGLGPDLAPPTLPRVGGPLARLHGGSAGAQRRDGGRSRVMQEYLRTMERFLEAQQQATMVYIGRRKPAAPRIQPGRGHGELNGADGLQRQELPVSEGPFCIAVSSVIPGIEMAATCRLDLQEHLFLLDHTLGKGPSRLDETLTALPVVPLTMSLEIMAQVASRLVSGKKLVGMKDVRAYQWIEVGENPLTLWLTARHASSETQEEVEVEILDGNGRGGSESTKGRLLAKGTILFGDEFPPRPEIGLFPVRSEGSFRVRPEHYYREMMFHGPRFQGVASIDRIGEDGIQATLKVLPGSDMFRSQKNSKLLTDPALLDAAGQLVGFWALERLEVGFVAFPIGFEHLAFYGPWPHGPESLKCYVRIVLPDAGRVRANIDVVRAEGELLAHVSAWEDMRLYDWTRQFVRFELLPEEVVLSTLWSEPIARFPQVAEFRCCRLSEDGDGIWLRMLAYTVLNRRERKMWFDLTGPVRRRKEWLLGRLAAKDAVRVFLKDRYQLALCPADIDIVTNEHGQPSVSEELLERLGCCISLSIAHAGGVAVAIAGDPGDHRGVGIDVEPLDRNHEGLEGVTLTQEEQRKLATIAAGERDEWLLRLWCAKEAVGKALGRGMLGAPLHLIVHDLDPATGRVGVALAGELAKQLPALAGSVLTAHTGCENGFVYASALV